MTLGNDSTSRIIASGRYDDIVVSIYLRERCRFLAHRADMKEADRS